MSVPEFLARAQGRVDLDRLAEATVVVFGVGTVGSTVVNELASSGVRRFRLIDGDTVEVTNLSRGALKREYIGRNKAEAMAELVHSNYPPDHFDIQYYPVFVDGAMSDDFLDRLIEDADLVVAATDQRDAQRRVAGRAVALDIPAIFPALHEASGEGEVFVCSGVHDPCFLCWEAFRRGGQDLRAVAALNVEAIPVIGLTVELALGLLDTDSVFARRWFSLESSRDRHRTLFLVQPGSPTQLVLVHWRPNCPMCPAPPAAVTQPATARETIDELRATAQRHPIAGLFAAWTAVTAILTLATGSGAAFFVSTILMLTTLWAFLRPDAGTYRWVRSTGGVGVAVGVILLSLFLAGVTTGNAIITVLMLAGLVGVGLAVTRRAPA